jgi:diamine N-acetyltransferase
MVTRPDGTEPIIAHGAVYLRSPEREDIPRFVAWLNDRRTSRTLSLRAPLSLVQEEQWFDGMLARQGRESWLFVICRVEDDRPVGNIGLEELDLVNGSAGLGIMIGDPADRGRGLGGDALCAMLAFAFDSLRLERVWLDVYAFNNGARRLYERIGFVREGVLRHAFWRDGRWIDAVRMAILVDEWRASRPDGRVGEPAPAAADDRP